MNSWPAIIRSPTWRPIPGSSHKRQSQNLDDFPYLKRWFDAVKARPGTQRAYEAGKSIQMRRPEELSDAEKSLLFGQDSSVIKR